MTPAPPIAVDPVLVDSTPMPSLATITTEAPPGAMPPSPASQRMVIGVAACLAMAIVLVAFFVVLYVRRRRRHSTHLADDDVLCTPPPEATPHIVLGKLADTKHSTPASSFGGHGPSVVEYHNSFTFSRPTEGTRSFAVDDVRDSAGSYRSDSTRGVYADMDVRQSTPSSLDRGISFGYLTTSPRSHASDLAMLELRVDDDDQAARRSSGTSSNYSIRVDSKEISDDDLNDADNVPSMRALSAAHKDGDNRRRSTASDVSSYHI
ncbi:unnamed protein product [Aphanomyces euteiches]